MSKKKNTLKDLDEFLKQQAASLVSPPKLSDKSVETPVLQESPVMQDAPGKSEISSESILHDLIELSKKEGLPFRKKFYDLILQYIENQAHSLPEDKILINTMLYLKHKDRWRDAIREYWRDQE